MPDPIIPNIAKEALMELAVGKRPSEPLILRLFSNDHEPRALDLVSDYVECPQADGYHEMRLDPRDWRIEGAIVDGQERLVCQHPRVVFTFTGALGEVWGWYLVGADSGELRNAVRLDPAPFIVAHEDDELKITPGFAWPDDLVPRR